MGPSPVKPDNGAEDMRVMFPDPERPVWEQFFSQRHRHLYESQPLVQSDAEVFRIFQRANFSRLSKFEGLSKPIETFLDPQYTIPQQSYDRMLPALRLATRLIKTTSFFFGTVIFGTIGQDEKDGSLGYIRDEKRQWCYDLEEGADLDSKFQEMFNRMSNIQFFTGKHPTNVDHAFGHTSTGMYPQGGTGKRMVSSGVQLHEKWTAFLCRLDYDDIRVHSKNRLLVLLAITIVHELVHVWYNLRKYEYARKGDMGTWMWLQSKSETTTGHPIEPRFFGDKEQGELGLAWERYAFNGEAILDWSRGTCYSQSSLLMLNPSVREGETAKWKGSYVVQVIDPGLVWAFLSNDCWGIYREMEGHRNHGICVGTLDLFGMMATVLAFRTVVEVKGRFPIPGEVYRQVYDSKLIVMRTSDVIFRHAERKLLLPALPPTPPPSPPPSTKHGWRPPTPPPTLPLTTPSAPPAKSSKPRAVTARQKHTDTLVYARGKLEEVISGVATPA